MVGAANEIREINHLASSYSLDAPSPATHGERMNAKFLAMSIDACTCSAAPRRRKSQRHGLALPVAVLLAAVALAVFGL